MATVQPDMMHFGRVANQLRDQIFSKTLNKYSDNLRVHQLQGLKVKATTRFVDDALKTQFSDPGYDHLKNLYFLTRVQDYYKTTLWERLCDLKFALPEFASADSSVTNSGIKV